MNLPFALPPITKGGAIPTWEKNGFRIGTEFTEVLQYSMNDSGWNDDLTLMHEASAGDQHFIDQASRQHALGELKKQLKQPNPTILEIGCSSGFMLTDMHEAFPEATIIGSDVVHAPLQNLAKKIPHVPFLRFDMVHCPLPDDSMDAIVMLNVLEHIDNDAEALRQAMRILKPGGALIIEVPAGPHLYDAYDKILMHYRRYQLSSFCQLLTDQQFRIIKRSHLGVFLYPGFWLVKQWNKRRLSESEAISRQKVDSAIRKTGSNKLMNFLMQVELRLGHYLSYPTGIRCLVTCIKPGVTYGK